MIDSRLGPYQLRAELGSGGMGKVYRAEVAGAVAGLDPGCAVALKVIHAHLLETPGFFKRFLREADIGTTIQHENVVRTYDCDALLHDGTQQNFLVMEYVEGQTLRDLLQELERVPEELCRHIGREVAKGLTAIHEAGVVHRDLKPENVLITAEHEVKIMDLGVARLRDEAVRLSQTGAFVGSLEYAAPEQFRSADGDPDGRADLHALGVVLYELATGQHPYRDEDASRVIGRILNDVPRKAGEVNPQLSPFFEEVVQTLIAKSRDERFATASDLASVLEEGEKSEWWKARAKALRVETKRPLRRIRIPRETALYGRDEDLARLHCLYDMAKAGDGQVLLIEGEAGIGKTRLVDEFIGRLRQEGEDINFVFGSYPPGGAATAAGAFSEAYREQFGAEGLEDTLAEYVKPTPILIPAFAAILKGETTPKDAEPLTKDSLQTVFVHATRGLAAERTTIVLIDDLHFAPEDGRALFSSLAAVLPEHRVLLIGTMRPGVPEEWAADLTRMDHADLRDLARLGPKDLARLLEDAFHSERLATDLGHRIALKSDGNPFFTFEIIRGLREGQFIAQEPDGTWVTTRVIQDLEVPSSVMDLVKARVGDLTDEERDLLDVASCCGFTFDPEIVADAAGVPLIPALKCLGRIERRHRLVRASGADCVFDHHQVQEAIYESLLPRLREAYHASIAASIEADAGAAVKEPQDLDGALCVDLCEHALKGARGEKALRYLEAALTHLESGYLGDQAIALADRALGVSDLLGNERRLEVLLRKNRLLDQAGRRDAQQAVIQEATDLAERLSQPEWDARVENARGIWHYGCSQYEQAREHFERSSAIARRVGDRQLELAGTGNAANVLLALGSTNDALERYEQQIAAARDIGDQQVEADARIGRGTALTALGRLDEARSEHELALAAARALGSRARESMAIGNLGAVCGSLGKYREARDHAERQLAMVREVGLRSSERVVTSNLGMIALHFGHAEDARRYLERAASMSRGMSDRAGESRSLSLLGELAGAQGDFEAMRAYLEQGLSIAREIGNPSLEAMASGDLGSALQGLGRLEEAKTCQEQALALAREIDDPHLECTAVGNIGWLLFNLGRPEEARRHFERSIAIALDIGNQDGAVNSLANLGFQDATEGNFQQARSRLEEALEHSRDTASATVTADALLALGRLHAEQSRRELAKNCLDETLAFARDRNNPGYHLLARCYLVALGWSEEGDARAAFEELQNRVDHSTKMEACFVLWQITGDRGFLGQAKRLLDSLVEHAAEEYRESMRKNVRLHREIMEAWAEHEVQGKGG